MSNCERGGGMRTDVLGTAWDTTDSQWVDLDLSGISTEEQVDQGQELIRSLCGRTTKYSAHGRICQTGRCASTNTDLRKV